MKLHFSFKNLEYPAVCRNISDEDCGFVTENIGLYFCAGAAHPSLLWRYILVKLQSHTSSQIHGAIMTLLSLQLKGSNLW